MNKLILTIALLSFIACKSKPSVKEELKLRSVSGNFNLPVGGQFAIVKDVKKIGKPSEIWENRDGPILAVFVNDSVRHICEYLSKDEQHLITNMMADSNISVQLIQLDDMPLMGDPAVDSMRKAQKQEQIKFLKYTFGDKVVFPMYVMYKDGEIIRAHGPFVFCEDYMRFLYGHSNLAERSIWLEK